MTQESSESQNAYLCAVDEFKDFYNANLPRLQSASASMATLLELLLTDHSDGFSTPTIVSRVKRLDECVVKFNRKYRAIAESAENYSIRDYITDLIGLRVICLYDDEIKAVQSVVKNEFEVIHVTDKTGDIEKLGAVFGYKGVHVDIRVHERRRILPEYKRFSDLQFEIQIRSTIQDSWSKLDQHVNYKKILPTDQQRRVFRLAALFELADQEFRLIRDERASSLGARVSLPSMFEPSDSAGIPSQIGLLNEAVMQIGLGLYGSYPFTPAPVNAFSGEILKMKPEATASWLLETTAIHAPEIEKYKEYQRTALMVRMNPYTFIRHILYAAEPQRFARFLYSRQIESYRAWKDAQSGGIDGMESE